jgi:tetratricopeptide (TPR) repeat protein
MSELLDYIDDYFTGALSAEEKQVFADRCVSDEAFAQEVAFYLGARAALKKQLQDQKQQALITTAVPKAKVRRISSYLVAAALIGIMALAGWWLFFRTPSVQQLSSQYIHEHLQQLGATMHSGSDSLQSGIAAYNNKNYQQAETIFASLSREENSTPDAVKYLGLVYLVTGKYDAAIVQFNRLIQYPLYANPGPFYKALALLQRNGPGDRQQARALLEEVRSNQLPGNKQANEWLKNISP